MQKSKTIQVVIQVHIDERNNQRLEVLVNDPTLPREAVIAWMQAAVQASMHDVFGSKLIVPGK